MARRVRTFIGDTTSDEALRPKHLSKQEFARRLYNLMNAKGWNQSELARQAGINRDSVSTYLNAKSLPEPRNAEALAAALGVTVTELLPNFVERAIDDDIPALEIKISTSAPGVAWLRVNRMVTTATCMKIAELLAADVVPD